MVRKLLIFVTCLHNQACHPIDCVFQIPFAFTKIPCLFVCLLRAYLFQLGNLGLDRRWVGTLDLGNHAPVLEELEGWHATDTAFGSNIGSFVDIPMDENGIGEFGGPCFKHWGDHAAGRAPGGSKVNDKKLVAGLEGVEFSNVCDVPM